MAHEELDKYEVIQEIGKGNNQYTFIHMQVALAQSLKSRRKQTAKFFAGRNSITAGCKSGRNSN
jgi:predicted transcriptional regulator